MEELWGHFLNLANARHSAWGPLPISYSEIKAYSEITGANFTYFEVEFIRELDLKVLPVIGKTVAHRIKAKRDGRDESAAVEIPISDAAGIRGLFKVVKARADAYFGSKNK